MKIRLTLAQLAAVDLIVALYKAAEAVGEGLLGRKIEGLIEEAHVCLGEAFDEFEIVGRIGDTLSIRRMADDKTIEAEIIVIR